MHRTERPLAKQPCEGLSDQQLSAVTAPPCRRLAAQHSFALTGFLSHCMVFKNSKLMTIYETRKLSKLHIICTLH